MATIVILSLDQSSSGVLIDTLESLRHQVSEVTDIDALLDVIAKNTVDLIFINATGDDQSGIAALKKLVASPYSVPAVVISSQASSELVIEVMRHGAFDHLYRASDLRELKSVVERALARPRDLETDNSLQSPGQLWLGVSPAMRQVQKLIGTAAASSASVLIQGETGTGKDTVARAIYRHSSYKNKPLTVVDCTAVPEDYESFECISEGAEGTVILDEIGDLNPQMQAMLVRALKEATGAGLPGDAKVRLIATTQYDLINMVRDKKFREDLYYRLNVLPIQLPPLRERGSDVISLAELFLSEAKPGASKKLSSSAVKVLLDYNWPGNVRELQNLMYHLSVVVRAQIIEESDLSAISKASGRSEIGSKATAAEASEHLTATSSALDIVDASEDLDYYSAICALEKRLLSRALAESHGSRAEAARLLGINRQLLYAKLKTHGLMDE